MNINIPLHLALVQFHAHVQSSFKQSTHFVLLLLNLVTLENNWEKMLLV